MDTGELLVQRGERLAPSKHTVGGVSTYIKLAFAPRTWSTTFLAQSKYSRLRSSDQLLGGLAMISRR